MSARLDAALAELAAAIRAEVRAQIETAAPAPDRLLSIDEAAAMLSLGRSKVYDLLDPATAALRFDIPKHRRMAVGRSCTVCNRPESGEIARLLEEGRSSRSLALEFGVSPAAMLRHVNGHIVGAVPRGSSSIAELDRVDLPNANPLDELVETLRPQALAGNPAIVHQYRLALAAQNDARHAAPARRDLAEEAEWIAVRTRMLDALERFPEARLAVAEALRGL